MKSKNWLLFFTLFLLIFANQTHACEIMLVSGGQNTIDRIKKKLPFYEDVAKCKLEFQRHSAELAFDHLVSGRADILIAGTVKSLFKNMEGRPTLAKLSENDLEQVLVNPIPITAMVHPDNPVEKIPPDQMRDILLGKITNWKAINGKDLPLTALVAKDKTNINSALFRKFLKDGETPKVEMTIDQIGLARAIRANPGGIAFMSEATTSAEGFTPKTFPSGASIDLYIVYKKDNKKEGLKKLAEHFKTAGPLKD